MTDDFKLINVTLNFKLVVIPFQGRKTDDVQKHPIFCMFLAESEKSLYSVIDKLPGADSMRFFPMSRVLDLPPGKTDRQTNIQKKRDRHRTERKKTQIVHSQMQSICKQPSLIKGLFISSVSVNAATTLQLCLGTGLIENNGAAPKCVATPF